MHRHALYMIISELLSFVKEQEGCILHPYNDPVGLLTIGYGHRIDCSCEAWSQEKADAQLQADLEDKYRALVVISPSVAHASQKRQMALLDFVFNLGEGAYQKSTLRKYVDVQDWASAATEILKWCHAGGRVLSQLVARRKVESEWLRNG